MRLRRIKNRILARWLALTAPPSWIDPECLVAHNSRILTSRLYGSVEVSEHSVLYRAEVSGSVHIGYSTTLWGPDIAIYAKKNPVHIGNYCSIARGVSIYEYLHDYERLSTYFVGRNVLGLPLEQEIESKGPISIGHDVWIGAFAHVMSGVSIGNGAVVAANAVVTKDVPGFAVVGGSPARILKFRFDETLRAEIEALAWWDWDHETIRRNAHMFTGKFVSGKHRADVKRDEPR
jgi:virginiamycin A acetyltransferase